MTKLLKFYLPLLFISLLVVAGIWYLQVKATDSGALSPGTMADDATVGTVAWSNPNNAKVSDSVYATASDATGAASQTHYLKATNFGFSIPSGATINGILVEIERKRQSLSTGGRPRDTVVKIVKADGSLGSTNKADTVTLWTTTDTYASYGSSSDLWGETWDDTKINDIDFGVVISANSPTSADGYTASVDHIRITVYYTVSVTVPLAPQQVMTKNASIIIKGASMTIKAQ